MENTVWRMIIKDFKVNTIFKIQNKKGTGNSIKKIFLSIKSTVFLIYNSLIKSLVSIEEFYIFY